MNAAHHLGRLRALLGEHWPSALLVLIGIATYANSLHGPFVFDDHDWLEGIASTGKRWPLYYLLQAPLDSPQKGRPLVCISIALNYALGGQNVTGYHIVNITVHLLAALAFMGVVHRTLLLKPLEKQFGRDARVLAFACALLWMVHPVQTECVNYITQRTESIMGLFYFLTLYCAIRARDVTGRRWWTASAIVFCALGMASKEVMVTAPFMVFLYDLVYRDKPAASLIRRFRPLYGGLAATWGLLATLLIVYPRERTGGFLGVITSWDYFKCQTLAIVDYLWTILWPKVLLLDYGEASRHSISEVAPAGILLLILLSLTVWALISRPALGYLGAWFFITLSPTSSFVPIVSEVAAERRLYLPLAGVVVLIVVGVYLGLQRFRVSSLVGRRLAFTMLLLVAGLLAGRTCLRNRQYTDPGSLWRDVVQNVPHNVRGLNHFGIILLDREDIEGAIRHFERALDIDPTDADSQVNIVFALAKNGDLDGAIACGRRAVRDHPGLALAHHFLGVVLHARRGNAEEAVRHFKIAIDLDPNDVVAHNDFGNCLVELKRSDEAIVHYERALELNPTYPLAHLNLGTTLQRQGKEELAIKHFREAVRLDPALLNTHQNLRAVVGGQE